ncbi:MAG: protein-tyrosine-phosphatase [Chlorobi bacterium]|nr:protein-tyrosine-phosphatase [Chlorobiota bacterium]
MVLLKQIKKTITLLDTTSIAIERKQILQPLIDYMQSKVNSKQVINLNFICTHNSRRSHLSQVWAQTMAYYFQIENVYCFSGGTEATAIYPMVTQTLRNSGFIVEKLSEGDNSKYNITYAVSEEPLVGFSKTYDDAFNPKSEFAAIMTCSQADASCPYIPGAEKRFPITYQDPKDFDNTPQQAEKYSERSIQIATEMKYVFSQIKPLKQ